MIIGKWYKIKTADRCETLKYDGFTKLISGNDLEVEFSNDKSEGVYYRFSEIISSIPTDAPDQTLLDYMTDKEPGELVAARDVWGGQITVVKANNDFVYKVHLLDGALLDYKVREEDQE